MTAQILSIKPPTLNALVTQTKAAWDRADQKQADADDWAHRTGKLLLELKRRTKEEGVRWLPVLKQLGRSERRARELMELAGGEVTIEQQRDRKRLSMEKSRAQKKAAPRGADLRDIPVTRDIPDTAEEDYAPPTMEERVQISLENLCGDVIARPAYFDKHFPGWRSVRLPSHVKTLVREAAAALSSLAATLAK